MDTGVWVLLTAWLRLQACVQAFVQVSPLVPLLSFCCPMLAHVVQGEVLFFYVRTCPLSSAVSFLTSFQSFLE